MPEPYDCRRGWADAFFGGAVCNGQRKMYPPVCENEGPEVGMSKVMFLIADKPFMCAKRWETDM